MEKDDVKNSLRIEYDLDDDLITQLIDMASSYIKGVIDSEALSVRLRVTSSLIGRYLY